MPIYEFQCEQCEEIFDVRASIKEKEAGLHPECPKCHNPETKQVVTAGLVIRGRDGASLAFPACGPDAGPACC